MKGPWYLSIALLCALLFQFQSAWALDIQEWQRFKKDFISVDGRVIDFSQKQCSHSEGQGYGLLLAVWYDDPQSFARIWGWTDDNLGSSRDDGLFVWKWGERRPGKWQVIDFNNATDGDTLIAYALLWAADKWHKQDYLIKAKRIIAAIRSHLVIDWQNKPFVLPAYYGFIQEDGFIINPSYLILPAYSFFSRFDEPVFWQEVRHHAVEFLTGMAYSDLRLPSDWALVGKRGTEIYESKSEYFSYDAIRVFLHLAWNGNVDKAPGITKFLDYVERTGRIPLAVNLKANSASLDDAPAGFYAIMARASEAMNRKKLAKRLRLEAREKIKHETRDYYSRTLYLLADITPNQ